MNAIDLLLQQHRQVDALFEAIEKADEGERASLLEECAEALTVHTTIEEQIFYPGVKRRETQDILKESVVEHLEVKRILADILDSEPENIDLDAAVKKLIEDVQHHVEEEESELFPKVRSIVDGDDLEDLGDRMVALAKRLQAEEDVTERIDEEKGAPAPL